MPRSGPISLTLPPFAGATRRLILANLFAFFGLAILGWTSAPVQSFLLTHLALVPARATLHGELWQIFTYAFINEGILPTLFALITVWFCGSLLEGSFGARWLYELYFVSLAGGGAIATALTFTHIFGLRPDATFAIGPYAGIFGMLIAIAAFFGELEFLLFFVLRIKAKYMVAIYILIAVAQVLKSSDTFGAMLELSGALSGFLYLKFAPRRGLAFGLTERYFSLRNEYYRSKRRRAARKFEVYMKQQNREVHFDKDGRYVDPDTLRDPNDKRWMN
ncbi:Membrane associated serine protease, rhomboid family [Granulicella rosea]|uniref:Membrane associated serine protease, rhomboid family n=1 Tax=Granulicella rosea TaxID=474952 RepID=A0A239LQR0_9BACT|nr:rhomboid family intramembrane serine protease [Granulicella rosea]SNT32715.1 Membrane associated serine protease, rhomboid family [Granulicella rosea]